MRRYSFFALLLALSFTLLPAAGLAAPPEEAVAGPPGSYIVVLESGDPQSVAAEHRRDHGAETGHVYRHALRGYSARMSPQAAARVAADPRVDYVDVDRVVTTTHHQCGHTARGVDGECDQGVGTVAGTVTEAGTGEAIGGATVSVGGTKGTTDGSGAYTVTDVPAGSQTVTATAEGYEDGSASTTVVDQETVTVDLALEPVATGEPPADTGYEVPLGLQRIFWGDSSAVSSTSSYPGIAIIDSGIAKHPDLNVVGGRNCSNGPPRRWDDGNGHGTHVAGTVAADGAIVGVAPAAPLYAVRVLNNTGSGSWADVICGIDWVTANAVGNNGPISVANMSLGGASSAASTCESSSLHGAICASVDQGVTYVASAGNSSANAEGFVPAKYKEVITVAAIADFDGAPGGLGDPTCRTDTDDSHANFSNYGTAAEGLPGHVDITAPGTCITSTWNDGGYRTISGTSMSAPHAAGAAALSLASGPRTPTQVRATLKGATNEDYSYTRDGTAPVPGIKPPLLDVSGL